MQEFIDYTNQLEVYKHINSGSGSDGHLVTPDRITVNNGFAMAMAGNQDVMKVTGHKSLSSFERIVR
jgi:hypothetical protein